MCFGVLPRTALSKLWLIHYFGVVICLRRSDLHLEALTYCAPLSPIKVRAWKGDCFCCSQEMSDVKKGWSEEIDKILTSCLRVSTPEEGGVSAKDERDCESICDLQVFCPILEERRYRHSLYAVGRHCLGKNLRKHKLGGVLHKVAKTFGLTADCQEDNVFNYVLQTQQKLAKSFQKEREAADKCTVLEPLPALIKAGDCMCCKEDVPTLGRHWSGKIDEVLENCLLGFRSIDNGIVDKDDCVTYCKSEGEYVSATQAIVHGSEKCGSESRTAFFVSEFSDGTHCLGRNTRHDSAFGRAFNKLAKTVGSIGECVSNPPYDKAHATALDTISEIYKELGKQVDSSKLQASPSSQSIKKLDRQREEDDESNIDESIGLSYLTRYGKISDERTLPFVHPRSYTYTERTDGQWRLASPFEHICGGARGERDYRQGYDGPTQYVSFSNMGQFRQEVDDCKQPFDVGQRRVRTSEEAVLQAGGLVFDLSKRSSAYKWCYEGGCVTTSRGEEICFQGSRDIEPWPFKCAQRAYQIQILRHHGSPKREWWNETNRKDVAESCVVWALRAREVLILPNPDKIKKGLWKNGVHVETDREPLSKMCISGFEDRCVTFNATSKSICCCKDVEADGAASCPAEICSFPR